MSSQITRAVAFLVIIAFTLSRAANAQTGDFNGDTVLDCQDIDLLHAEIRNGTNNPQFDLNGDQLVDQRDRQPWLDEAGVVWGDANFDHHVDHLDLNIVGLNWLSTPAGYCQGDLSGDDLVGAADDDVVSSNRTFIQDYAASVVTHAIPSPLDAWRDPAGVVFAETEHFELVSIPQAAPDGLLATVLGVRTKSATNRVATLRQLSFTGDLHQVAWEFRSFTTDTAVIDDFTSPETLPDDWRQVDSHIVISDDDLGALIVPPGAMSEDNDLSNPAGLNDQLSHFSLLFDDIPAMTGIGGIGVDRYALFSLDTPLQDNFVEVAQLLTPAVMPDTGQRGEVFFRVGILGGDESNVPLPDEGVVGLDEPLAVPFFPEPCDFDGDGRCDVVDLDALLAALDTSNAAFDLQEDGIINLNDRDQWLDLAGEEALGEPFVLGDTNLNGAVDATDLNNLGLNWLSTDDSLSWSGGDFNGDHAVNAADLNELGLNWLHGVAAGPVQTVPEPSAWVMLSIVFLITERCCRKTKTQ